MHDFSILVLPGSFASSVALTLDILAAAATIAPRLGVAAPRWRVLSTEASVQLSSGLRLDAKVLPKSVRADGSTWIIPGLGLDNRSAINQRFRMDDAQRAIKAVQVHAKSGGAIAASCSGVFMLQAAGLLDKRSVTTSWWLAPLLQQLAPTCKVDADRMVLCDGPIVTGGAALAQGEMMLHLIRNQCGPALADAISRALLIDGRQSQAQFVVPAMLANGSELVSRLVKRFESALPDAPGVAELAGEFGMSERTLSRHVRAATGKSTSALLQGVRLTRARALLENSKMTVEQVAEQVGYVDTTALRRLMRKVMGATPRQFRPAVSEGAPSR